MQDRPGHAPTTFSLFFSVSFTLLLTVETRECVTIRVQRKQRRKTVQHATQS
jgi:hypothetical protein